MTKTPLSLLFTAAIGLMSGTSVAYAGNECSAGNTLTDDRLTVATGNPAYPPWVMNDAPESGEGFEAAVAYAVAERMGFSQDNVDWVRTSFDEAIQPGEKNFDFNLQQYSIKPERLEVIDFSEPYYTTTMAVVVKEGSEAENTQPTASALKALKFGAAAGTTSQPFLEKVLQPEQACYTMTTQMLSRLLLPIRLMPLYSICPPHYLYLPYSLTVANWWVNFR